MKYVIFIDRRHDAVRASFLIFPERMVHHTVAMGYVAAVKAQEKHQLKIGSAGFCYNDDDNSRWYCKSGSESLGIAENENETMLANIVLNQPEAMQGML
jgi:hypothetical protein